MTLQEKIDNIVKHNKLGITSATNLERFLEAGQGSITTPMKKNGKLGQKLLNLLHEKARVRHEFMETGTGPIFEDPPAETAKVLKETFYRDLIENNPEYSLLPKAILKDYQIVPEKIFNMISQANDELKSALVSKYELMISALEAENETLRKRLESPVNR